MNYFNLQGVGNHLGSKEDQLPEGNTDSQPTTQDTRTQYQRNPFLKGDGASSGRKHTTLINRDEPIVEGIELS